MVVHDNNAQVEEEPAQKKKKKKKRVYFPPWSWLTDRIVAESATCFQRVLKESEEGTTVTRLGKSMIPWVNENGDTVMVQTMQYKVERKDTKRKKKSTVRIVTASRTIIQEDPAKINDVSYKWNREFLCSCPGSGQLHRPGQYPPWRVCVHCSHVLLFELTERKRKERREREEELMRVTTAQIEGMCGDDHPELQLVATG